MKQLVILAGGKGSRLKDIAGDMPKPMFEIGGKPVLEHQIELARAHGFSNILLLLGHKPNAIIDYFGDGEQWGIHLDYEIEGRPLGTAGAVLRAFNRLDSRFMVLYGDVLVGVDLERMWRAHAATGADATLFVHPNDHPHDSDIVEVDTEDRITAFHRYPHPDGVWLPNLVNAALYVVEKQAIADFRHGVGKLDFAKDLFPAMLASGVELRAYRSREYIKDMGTPERARRVREDYANGVVDRQSLQQQLPAVFLDRDGTLVRKVDHLSAPSEVELLPGAAEAVRRVNKSRYLAVMITNQPVVARGECSEETLQVIHNKIETLLGAQGAYLDRIYYCPHHPDAGYPGERPELKVECECRKPAIGMVERAVQDLNIDLRASWVIGDTTRDIQTAANAGSRSILVETGDAGTDARFPAQPHHRCRDVRAAVDHILCCQ